MPAYSYALNNPLAFVDRSGLSPWSFYNSALNDVIFQNRDYDYDPWRDAPDFDDVIQPHNPPGFKDELLVLPELALASPERPKAVEALRAFAAAGALVIGGTHYDGRMSRWTAWTREMEVIWIQPASSHR